MKLALGTVQFGLEYGITNTTGQVKLAEVERILDYCRNVGIHTLDTAIAYGSSEQVLGQFNLSSFNLISKLPSLKTGLCISDEVKRSFERLNINTLYGLLLHCEDDLLSDTSTNFFTQLEALKKEGLIEKIGVSFYSPDVAIQVVNEYAIDLIQIPANHLDTRFSKAGVLGLASKKNIEVHARSLFLQGLLIVEKRPSQFDAHPDLLKFDEQAQKVGCSKLELALSYLLQNKRIQKGVVGCLNVEQLDEIVQAYKQIQNGLESQALLDLSASDETLINPSLWQIEKEA